MTALTFPQPCDHRRGGMTYVQMRLQIARHEARQLRRTPPRLWPLVHQEAKAWRELCVAHRRFVKVKPLEVDKRTRLA